MDNIIKRSEIKKLKNIQFNIDAHLLEPEETDNYLKGLGYSEQQIDQLLTLIYWANDEENPNRNIDKLLENGWTIDNEEDTNTAIFKKFSTNNIQVSPFAYELDGSYQAITEHPEVVTYSTDIEGHTSEKNKSVDYTNYILKPFHRPAEAVSRLGYFEELMKKYKIKDIAELELMIETYIDERGEY